MTAQTMIDELNKLIEEEYKKLDAATRKNYLETRKAILAALAILWTKAAITPRKDPITGAVAYVSRAEAFKYGRMKVFEGQVKGIASTGALTDISNIEYGGMRVYQLEYNGYAWIYNQAYGLPLTAGVKVPLMAEAIYSDDAGQTFTQNLRKRWAAYADDIITTTTRDLNQGASYFATAKDIQNLTDSSYADALRIARTEAHRIQMASYLDGLGMLDDLDVDYGKMWFSAIDSATRDAHQTLDGQMADAQGVFYSPAGGAGQAPGHMGVAKDDINCRCSVETIIDDQKPSERRVRGEGLVKYETFTQRLARGGDIPLITLRKAKP